MIDYTYEEIIGYLESIKELNILIIGETIVDIYQYGYTLGKSGKAPIVAFKNGEKETYLGGILAISNHLKDFVKNVDYATHDIAIIKKRYIQENQKLFETYTEIPNEYMDTYQDIDTYDMVIIADFGHGYLDREKRRNIEDKAKFIALNTQMNAGNMGLNTINKYGKVDYTCIDYNELRLATSNQFNNIENILKERFNEDLVAITRSKDGCTIYKNQELYDIPALTNKIIDSVGAGDAFLSITSPLAYIDAPADIIGFIGNAAGAIICNYVGNKESLNKNELYGFIKETLNKNEKI